MPTGGRSGMHRRKQPLYHPDEVRARIKATQLINRLQAHIFDGLELSMSQVRGIEILLRKCIPDLTAVAVKADVTHRFVALLPDVLSKEEWIKRYGDPKQLEGTGNGQENGTTGGLAKTQILQ